MLSQDNPTMSAAEKADSAFLLGQQTAFLHCMCSSVRIEHQATVLKALMSQSHLQRSMVAASCQTH